MSWRATAWAKETTGHKSIAEKFLLMVLSDYASPDDNQCWPSQAKLASLCMMTERGVRNCLDRLEANGFVTRLKKGNQHQPSLYRVNVGHSAEIVASGATIAIVASGATIAPIYEPEICAIESSDVEFSRSGSYSCAPEQSEPELISGAKVNRNSERSEPELSDSEPEMRSSEPELWVCTNRHLEPSLIKPSIEPLGDGRETEVSPRVPPEFQSAFEVFLGIPGNQASETDLAQLASHFARTGIPPDRVEDTAWELQSKLAFNPREQFWEYTTSSGRKKSSNLCALLRSWAKRPPLSGSNGHHRPEKPASRFEDQEATLAEFRRLAKRFPAHRTGPPQ